MSGTNVMAQKPHFTPKSENCRKCIEASTGVSLVVCIEKKTFEVWVRGVP